MRPKRVLAPGPQSARGETMLSADLGAPGSLLMKGQSLEGKERPRGRQGERTGREKRRARREGGEGRKKQLLDGILRPIL